MLKKDIIHIQQLSLNNMEATRPILYFECSSGASGDMILSALLDLGLPEEKLKANFNKVSIPLSFQVKQVERNGIQAKQIIPELPKDKKKNWGLYDFLEIIRASQLSPKEKNQCSNSFQKLAEVEGKIHGKSPEQVHFHELGGWDTLFDLIGVITGLNYFHPAQIFVGPVHVGKGFIKTKHGDLPVPPPAVIEMLKGFSIYSGDIKEELVTPTGALILSSWGKPCSGIPEMQLEKTGSGAGAKTLKIPNILRIMMGNLITMNRNSISMDSKTSTVKNEINQKYSTQEDEILKLETNIDDMNPQIWDYLFEKLYESGVLEAFITPVVMKKSRPAYVLTVLCPLEIEPQITKLIFVETTTIGIRKERIQRKILNRTIKEVATKHGNVPVKFSSANGEILTASPEYEVMKKIAREKNIPLKKIYEEVVNAFHQTKQKT